MQRLIPTPEPLIVAYLMFLFHYLWLKREEQRSSKPRAKAFWAAQLMSANFRCIFRPTLESSFLTNDGISTNSDHIRRSSNIEETE